MVVLESYACGTPVVASRIGSLDEIVRDGITGAKFEPGNPLDIAAAVSRLLKNPEMLKTMRQNARAEFLDKYTSEKNIKLLDGIYQHTIDDFARSRTKTLLNSF
jgi:glycosyltransferase involved in cell wall biosynthesis